MLLPCCLTFCPSFCLDVVAVVAIVSGTQCLNKCRDGRKQMAGAVGMACCFVFVVAFVVALCI